MKHYAPLPTGEVIKWAQQFEGKSLDELIALLGPPVREHGESPRHEAAADGTPYEAGKYIKTLEFKDISPSVKALLIDVCEDEQFVFEFYGRELTDT